MDRVLLRSSVSPCFLLVLWVPFVYFLYNFVCCLRFSFYHTFSLYLSKKKKKTRKVIEVSMIMRFGLIMAFICRLLVVTHQDSRRPK